MKQKFRRRYLVNGTYQLTQAGVALLANILVVLLIAFLLTWYFLIGSDSSMVVNCNRQIPVYISGCVLVVALLSVLFSMRRSRSTAGMMAILNKILTDAGQDKFPDRPLSFRQSDYSGFRELAGPLNTCISKMKNNHESEIRDAVEKLKDLARTTGKEDMEPAGISRDLKGIIRTLEQDNPLMED